MSKLGDKATGKEDEEGGRDRQTGRANHLLSNSAGRIRRSSVVLKLMAREWCTGSCLVCFCLPL